MTQVRIIRLVATNDRGMRIGESHQNAKLTDAEVDQVRDLHEFAGWGYCEIAAVYGVSKWSIARICRYQRRNQPYFRWKRVEAVVDAHDEELVGQD